MNPRNPQVGDTGTLISVDTLMESSSLTSATTLELLVTKPDGTEVTWPGTANGSRIEYNCVVGDLDQEKDYIVRSHVINPAGEWTGHPATFTVDAYD